MSARIRVVESRAEGAYIDEVLSDIVAGNVPVVGNVAVTLKGFGVTLEGTLDYYDGDEYSLDHPDGGRAYVVFHRDGVEVVAYEVEEPVR